MLREWFESSEYNPYLRMRIGKVEEVYYSSGASSGPDARKMGRIKVTWQDSTKCDKMGGKDNVFLTFPCFSNPVNVVESPTPSATPPTLVLGTAYGDLMLPGNGDLVIIAFVDQSTAIVLGHLPANYAKQTISNDKSTDTSISAQARSALAGISNPMSLVQQKLGIEQKDIQGFDTLRQIVPGEFSRTSKQKTEIYQDRAGGVHIIAKAQLSKNVAVPKQDGSDVTALADIDLKKRPSVEIARVTVGEVYTDDNFTTKDKNSQGNPLVMRVATPTGVRITIDVKGNVEIMSDSVSVLTNDRKAIVQVKTETSPANGAIPASTSSKAIVTAQEIDLVADAIVASCGRDDKASIVISEDGVHIDCGDVNNGVVTIGKGAPMSPVLYYKGLDGNQGDIAVEDLDDIGISSSVWVSES